MHNYAYPPIPPGPPGRPRCRVGSEPPDRSPAAELRSGELVPGGVGLGARRELDGGDRSGDPGAVEAISSSSAGAGTRLTRLTKALPNATDSNANSDTCGHRSSKFSPTYNFDRQSLDLGIRVTSTGILDLILVSYRQNGEVKQAVIQAGTEDPSTNAVVSISDIVPPNPNAKGPMIWANGVSQFYVSCYEQVSSGHWVWGQRGDDDPGAPRGALDRPCRHLHRLPHPHSRTCGLTDQRSTRRSLAYLLIY